MAEEKKTKKIPNLVTPILAILLVVVAFLAGMFWTKIRTLEKKEAGKIAQVTPSPKQEEGAVLGGELKPVGIGSFKETENEICQENGKPIVYFFGRASCPYCVWEHPIFEKATAKFAGLISLHNNMDDQEADRDVWGEYSGVNKGAVPFMILGCRYTQLGSGDQKAGEAQEEKNITALVCKLTGGEPGSVCEEVTDLTEQIE